MSWQDEVDELERRREHAKQQGGRAGIARQHARGRLTIRERIDALLDPDTFQEQGKATASPEYGEDGEPIGFTPANYVVGFGTIEGRRAESKTSSPPKVDEVLRYQALAASASGIASPSSRKDRAMRYLGKGGRS